MATKKRANILKPPAPGGQRSLPDNILAMIWKRIEDALDDVRIGVATAIDEDKLTCTVSYPVKGGGKPPADDEGVPLRLYTGGGDVGLYTIPEDGSLVVMVMVDGQRPALLYVARPEKIIFKSSTGLELRADATTGAVDLRSLKTLTINDGGYSLVRHEEFQALYNAHTHPTQVGLSGPPQQPMSDQQKCPTIKVD